MNYSKDIANPDDIGYPWEQDEWRELCDLTEQERENLMQESLHGLDDHADDDYYKEPF